MSRQYRICSTLNIVRNNFFKNDTAALVLLKFTFNFEINITYLYYKPIGCVFRVIYRTDSVPWSTVSDFLNRWVYLSHGFAPLDQTSRQRIQAHGRLFLTCKSTDLRVGLHVLRHFSEQVGHGIKSMVFVLDAIPYTDTFTSM